MPFWCVGNQLLDPFGLVILAFLTSIQVCEIICRAAKRGLIEFTSAHDDDLIAWNPKNPSLITAEQWKTLRAIKSMLDAAGVKFNMITCNLHSNPIFRDGGLTNPNPEIRRLARLKVRRTLEIGHFLNARYYTYWVARDGYEVAAKVVWKKVYKWIAEGLNDVRRCIRENKYTNYRGGTVEAKPDEPRGHSFLPTSAHAVAFINLLEEPDFWGVNPELTQHEGMTLLDPVTTVGFLVSLKKLKFLHFGNQIKGQFDDDFPSLIGPEHLKETVQMFWVLMTTGWRGVVEFDCHMLRCEADPKDPMGCRDRFIENCSIGLQMALELAGRYAPSVSKNRRESHSRADLKTMAEMCNLNFAKMVKKATKQIAT